MRLVAKCTACRETVPKHLPTGQENKSQCCVRFIPSCGFFVRKLPGRKARQCFRLQTFIPVGNDAVPLWTRLLVSAKLHSVGVGYAGMELLFDKWSLLGTVQE